jgi:hypothetical protein
MAKVAQVETIEKKTGMVQHVMRIHKVEKIIPASMPPPWLPGIFCSLM